MKKIMTVGRIGCGKTTLCQRLLKQTLEYKKTQAIELLGGSAIDTPGEYAESRAFYRALMVTAVEADIVLLLQQSGDDTCRYAPGLSSMFAKPVIGVVTKVDEFPLQTQKDTAETILKLAGAKPIFFLSSVTGEGIEQLAQYLTEDVNH